MYYVLDGASKRFKTISNFKKVHGKKHLTEPENRIRKYVIQENKENHHCKGLVRGGGGAEIITEEAGPDQGLL